MQYVKGIWNASIVLGGDSLILIRPANGGDFKTILAYDKWIGKDSLKQKIDNRQVYVAHDGDTFTGWLRYGLFWDSCPFMNMLRVLEGCREKGIGKALVEYWENEMKRLGHQIVLTSTAQTETAQHFYVKLGYRAIGGFTLTDEPLELIFVKYL